MAGSADRLRPHVKTHKIPEIVQLQVRHGIRKVKCSTIAETEMAARAGADDILLAYQPVGPNIQRFFSLPRKFPSKKFSCISDCESILRELSDHASVTGYKAHIWLDINAGMNRTGIEPGEKARELFRMISLLPGLVPAGLPWPARFRRRLGKPLRRQGRVLAQDDDRAGGSRRLCTPRRRLPVHRRVEPIPADAGDRGQAAKTFVYIVQVKHGDSPLPPETQRPDASALPGICRRQSCRAAPATAPAADSAA